MQRNLFDIYTYCVLYGGRAFARACARSMTPSHQPRFSGHRSLRRFDINVDGFYMSFQVVFRSLPIRDPIGDWFIG